MEKAQGPEGDAEDPGDFEQACKKSVQALRDCLEIGLNGEGD
jgi:hypothetical protein